VPGPRLASTTLVQPVGVPVAVVGGAETTTMNTRSLPSAVVPAGRVGAPEVVAVACWVDAT